MARARHVEQNAFDLRRRRYQPAAGVGLCRRLRAAHRLTDSKHPDEKNRISPRTGHLGSTTLYLRTRFLWLGPLGLPQSTAPSNNSDAKASQYQREPTADHSVEHQLEFVLDSWVRARRWVSCKIAVRLTQEHTLQLMRSQSRHHPWFEASPKSRPPQRRRHIGVLALPAVKPKPSHTVDSSKNIEYLILNHLPSVSVMTSDRGEMI
jgi:hypothetical protein